MHARCQRVLQAAPCLSKPSNNVLEALFSGYASPIARKEVQSLVHTNKTNAPQAEKEKQRRGRKVLE